MTLLSTRTIVSGLAVLGLALPMTLVAQTQPPTQTTQTPAKPVGVNPADATQLAAGWAALGQNEPARAAAIANTVLGADPRSSAAADLLVSAEIARAGSAAGLDAYEHWLGQRRLDDGYVLRRVALALARETAQDAKAAPDARREAIDALAADGDTDILITIARGASGGDANDLQLLARLGSESAVKALIAQLASDQGYKPSLIASLAATRNPLAVPPLVKLLKDPNPNLRASAADGLGQIGDQSAVTALQPLLKDAIPFVHFAAASALLRLNDTSGLAFLREEEASDQPQVSASALEAMSSMPDRTWQASVERLLADPNPLVRLKAAQLIAPYDLDAARRVLEGLMTDDNLAIREEAAKVYLNEIASDFRALRGQLRGADPATRVRAAARILSLTR